MKQKNNTFLPKPKKSVSNSLSEALTWHATPMVSTITTY